MIVPVLHETVNWCDIDGFEMALQVAVRYFTHDIGFWFHSTSDGIILYDLAYEEYYGADDAWVIIIINGKPVSLLVVISVPPKREERNADSRTDQPVHNMTLPKKQRLSQYAFQAFSTSPDDMEIGMTSSLAQHHEALSACLGIRYFIVTQSRTVFANQIHQYQVHS